jgi:hypothetical protein
MSQQTWNECIVAAQADSTALTASVTPTSILPAGAVFTMPQGLLSYIGKTLRLKAFGRISTVVTTPGTLTLDVRFGAVVVFNGGAMALNIVAKTNVTWMLDLMLTMRVLGATAQMIGAGIFASEAVIGCAVPTVGSSGVLLLPTSAPAVGTAFDSTAANTVNLFGTWSINNADSIQTHIATLEALN